MPRDIIVEGDGHRSRDSQKKVAVSIPSPTPKRGRPRKATEPVSPIVVVPTGAPIAEMPHENAAGGGLRKNDTLRKFASPISNQIGGDAVADETGQKLSDAQDVPARSSAHPLQTPAETPVGGGHSTLGTHTDVASPSTHTAAAVLDAGGGGEVRAKVSVTSITSVPDLAPLIEELINLQRERVWLIRMKNRIENGTTAYVRRVLIGSADLSDAEREKMNARAKSIVSKIENEKPLLPEERKAGVKCQHMILHGKKARLTFEESITASKITMPDGTVSPGINNRMEQIAKQFPVWEWAKNIKGFGPLGLAVIIAETGDLSNYANPGKVWKRLGLAPYNGKSGMAWRVSGGLTKDEWIDFKYKPARRSEMFQRVEPLLKHQLAKVKTGEREPGPYGRVYLDRKKYELDRDPEMSKGRAHDRATRYMEKRLLKHLWQAWRGLPVSDDHVPSS